MRKVVEDEHGDSEIEFVAVGSLQFLNELRVRNDVGPDANSHKAVGADQRKTHQSIQHQRKVRVVQVFGAELPLHLSLVAAVVRNVEKETADQHRPKSEGLIVSQPVTRETHRLKSRKVVGLAGFAGQYLTGLRKKLEYFRQTADCIYRIDNTEQDTQIKNRHLDHIGEDHGLHAAQHIVDNGDDAQQQYGGPKRKPDDLLQHQRNPVNSHAGGERS